ncbi:MAG: hypothetical protein ACYDEP_09215 [Acidimicrobiales bacterium]
MTTPRQRRTVPATWLLMLVVIVVSAGCGGSPSLSAGSTSTSTSRAQTTVPVTGATGAGQVTTTLDRIAFFNPRQGYGLFDKRPSNSSSCQSFIAKTTDGGAHFTHLGTVDTWPCASSRSATSLAFDNHGDGFVYGPKLFVTHNGGVTWHPDAQPGTVTAVAAIGYSVWMVEGVCPSGVSSPATTCPLQLLESSNGGRTWAPSPSQPSGANASAGALTLEPALGQSWLVRASSSAAYLLSNPTRTQNGSASSAPLWYTSNGGSSWTTEELPCGQGALSVALSLAPDGSLTAVCASEASAGAQPKSTSVSRDGGRTWAIHTPCFGSVPTQCTNSSPLNFGYLGSIDSVSAGTTFLVGGRSELLVTRDGGKQWQPIEPLIGGTGSGTKQVIFFNGYDGVVLGVHSSTEEPAIWSTTDIGFHWSKVVPSVN